MYVLIGIIIFFLLGLYYCMNYGHQDIIEGFNTALCPNILIQKGSSIYLYNSNKAKVPGVNPLRFNNLEDYTEFIQWQRSQGIRCPVLFLQQSYDTQGQEVYKIRPDVIETDGGLPPTIPIGRTLPQQSKLLDAGRDMGPYNRGDFPSFDHDNQYIGLDVPLDKLFHEEEQTEIQSDNPMDINWGGPAYSQQVVESGKYVGSEVHMPPALD